MELRTNDGFQDDETTMWQRTIIGRGATIGPGRWMGRNRSQSVAIGRNQVGGGKAWWVVGRLGGCGVEGFQRRLACSQSTRATQHAKQFQ